MKKNKPDRKDDLRPEYDLKRLPVRRFLESDVAEAFPTADAVNEALRFLIRITKENKPSSGAPGSRT